MSDLQALIAITSGYLHDVDLDPLIRAYNFAVKAHASRRHRSGEPYISHLLDVSTTLASMKLDLDTVVAGMLHGVLKEEVGTEEELREQFGNSVTNLVSGSTRITNVRYDSQLANQADNIRKLLMAMGADVRVLLVKLADRLHDMAVLHVHDREEQRRIAQETLDLYAPLASRLGIDWMKRELEDRGFQYLFPAEYNDLISKLQSSTSQREDYVREVIAVLKDKLAENGVRPLRVMGRPKHLYSIYKKLVAQDIPLDRIFDKVAFRVIVETVKECYEAFGTVHGAWQPVPGRIKDYISTPKSNNYQSLHTTVIGPEGQAIEIQIRTEEMDKVAQEGVAAHWAYKEGKKVSGDDSRLFSDLKSLVQSLQDVADPGEFLESVRGELYDPDIYVLTPTGEVRELPRGSTPIDFAYSIHSAVGDHCVGAKVNEQIVPLRHELQNGDIVEIVTSKSQQPRAAWLQIVKTSRARTRIRSHLRRAERDQWLEAGREICELELQKLNTTLKKLLKTGHIRELLKSLNCNALDEMLIKVGSGAITVNHLFRALQPEEFREQEEQRRQVEVIAQSEKKGASARPAPGRMAVDVDGLDDMLVKMGQCCKPLPGDPIVGFITTGSGVSVHKADCAQLKAMDPERRVEVSWSTVGNAKHQAELRLRVEDRKNVVADVSGSISADEADIIQFNSSRSPEGLMEMALIVEVADLEQLQVVQQHLRQLPAVIDVRRK